MLVSITVVKYRRLFAPLALMAMAIHRIPLMLDKTCTFWKLMGCGKNGGFNLQPDWQMWVTLAAWKSREDFDRFYNSSFIALWWKKLAKEEWTILCEPLSSHGKWSGEEPFIASVQSNDVKYQGPVAVLTRATIRPLKVKSFWANVGKVAAIMGTSKGYVTSLSMGEAPFYLQATLSIWESMDDVVNFAYKSPEHAEVIRKTRTENWYSEELFARFRPIASFGSLNNIDPLARLIKPESQPINH